MAQLFLYWFTQSQSYIQFTRTAWAWFPLYSNVLQITNQDYTFEHKTHKIFDSHKNLEPQPTRITLADLKSHQANHPEAQEHPNLMVAVPSIPYMCSSSYLQAKMPPKSTKINQDLQTTSSSYVLQRENASQRWMPQFGSEKLRFAPLLAKTRLI